jgi:curved DNA-binding protein CbpA
VDDGELSAAQRREIDAMYESLSALSPYDLLGVPRDATPAALRASYDELARAFAPDRFARKRLGSFQRKLEIISACVNEAYLTLLDPERRAASDARWAKKQVG